MRFAVISDIHGNALALDAVLADIARETVDTICNLGDHLSGPFEPGRTLSLIRGTPMIAIRGNHDRYVAITARGDMDLIDALAFDETGDEGLDWIAALPETALVGGSLFLCHGTPRSDATHWLYGKDADKRMQPRDPAQIARAADGIAAPVIACGHTHIQRAVELADGRIVFNPGSVGRPALCLAEAGDARHASPQAQYAIVSRESEGWRVAFRQVGYDHAQAAALAERHGRPVWAENMRSGWAR